MNTVSSEGQSQIFYSVLYNKDKIYPICTVQCTRGKKISLLYIQSMVIRLKGDILRHTAINLHYYIVRISRERYNSECLQTENTVETLSKPAFLVNVVKIDSIINAEKYHQTLILLLTGKCFNGKEFDF